MKSTLTKPQTSFYDGVSICYLHSFNGQEKDDEINGEGNINTAEYWEYDTRLGRRWNLDPVTNASESPYAAFGNNPILNTDVNGDEFVNSHTAKKKEAKEKMDISEKVLAARKEEFNNKYGSKNLDEIKNNKKEYKEYKRDLSKVNDAESKFNGNKSKFEDQVRFEKIADEIINEFRNANGPEFDFWNKKENIYVSVQDDAIIRYDKQTGERIGTTNEGTGAILKNDKLTVTSSKLQVQVKDNVVKIVDMTRVMVHGLGHYKKESKISSEEDADRYQQGVYNK